MRFTALDKRTGNTNGSGLKTPRLREMSTDLLADGFSSDTYWNAGLEPFETPPSDAVREADIAIVGGGYAGLSAALTLARAGRNVAVLEASTIGDGDAARSAGSLSHVPKASLTDLTERYGEDVARGVYREARSAREFVEGLIREHQIQCGLRSGWRFLAAHSPRAFERQRKALPALRETWGEVHLIERARQRELIGSDAFFGGVKIANSATLQPSLLQRGLARAASAAGAGLIQRRRVTGITRSDTGFELETSAGVFKCGELILATNAQTDIGAPPVRRLRQRIVKVNAYALATEEVSPQTMREVLPIGGPVSDTYKIINYIAPNENGRRFILSGRAGRSDGDIATKARRMFGYFRDRFPGLRDVKVAYCWLGHFATTGDWIPHVGVEDGIHYVLGCCGTGIPMATYLGHKAALMLLEGKRGLTVFDRPLPALPFMGLAEPLLPLAVRGYELRDRFFR